MTEIKHKKHLQWLKKKKKKSFRLEIYWKLNKKTGHHRLQFQMETSAGIEQLCPCRNPLCACKILFPLFSPLFLIHAIHVQPYVYIQTVSHESIQEEGASVWRLACFICHVKPVGVHSQSLLSLPCSCRLQPLCEALLILVWLDTDLRESQNRSDNTVRTVIAS